MIYYKTEIKIGEKYYKTTSSSQEIIEMKNKFLLTTVSNTKLVSNGNGAYENEELTPKDFPKEIFINTSLIETIEEIH